MKKTISLFLALVLLMSVFSLVFADEIGEQYYTVKVEYSDNVGKKEQLNLMVQGYNVYVDAKMLAERFGYTFGENGNCAVIFNKDKDWKLDLRVNEHTELEIFAEENPPKRVNRPEACGLRHLAFCVDSVEQTVRELAEVGIEYEPIRVDDYTGKKMTFFHDPDGLPLELHE